MELIKIDRVNVINGYNVVTNMKVMFSTINSLEERYPISNKSDFNKNNECVFLYRNTVDRVISCFLNWCINNAKRIGIMELLSKIENFDYNLFCELIENIYFLSLK